MSVRLLGSAAAEFRLLALRRQTWDRIIYISLYYSRGAQHLLFIYFTLEVFHNAAGQIARKLSIHSFYESCIIKKSTNIYK